MVKNYQEFGDAGLIRSREKKTYSFEFKLHVVELYLTSEGLVSRIGTVTRHEQSYTYHQVGQ